MCEACLHSLAPSLVVQGRYAGPKLLQSSHAVEAHLQLQRRAFSSQGQLQLILAVPADKVKQPGPDDSTRPLEWKLRACLSGTDL